MAHISLITSKAFTFSIIFVFFCFLSFSSISVILLGLLLPEEVGTTFFAANNAKLTRLESTQRKKLPPYTRVTGRS